MAAILAELSRNRRLLAVSAVVVGLIAAPAALVLAQTAAIDQAGALVEIVGTGGSVRAAGASITIGGKALDVRAAGAVIDVSAETAGGISALGARVAVSGPVGGSVDAAAATIVLTGKLGGDANFAGADVTVDSAIGGNLRAGGASVTVGPSADIAGTVEIGGARILFGGHAIGEVNLGGAVVTFNGSADGLVKIGGERVMIGAGARIGGALTVYSRNAPVVAEGAEITGGITRVSPPDWIPVSGWVWIAGLAVVVAFGTILAGGVLMLVGGRIFAAATDHVRHRPVTSFVIGLATLVLIPTIAIILMATVIGLTLGFALLLVIPILMVFGHAIAAAGIAAGAFIRAGGPIGIGRLLLLLVAGAVIVVAIGAIPWVGLWALAIVLVLGTGAFVRTLWAKLRFVPAPAPV